MFLHYYLDCLIAYLLKSAKNIGVLLIISLALTTLVYSNLKNYIKKDVHAIQDVAKIIAKIDVFQSLAMISSENSYVRPTFNHNKVFKVVDGRHGVIERVMAQGTYV